MKKQHLHLYGFIFPGPNMFVAHLNRILFDEYHYEDVYERKKEGDVMKDRINCRVHVDRSEGELVRSAINWADSEVTSTVILCTRPHPHPHPWPED